jgi:hypothetical protein
MASDDFVQLYTCAVVDNASSAAEVCRALLEYGSVLPTAMVRGNIALLRLLLADGRADPTKNDSHVLRVAATCGSHAALQLLLEDGRADPAAALKQLLMFHAHHPSSRAVALRIEQNLPVLRAAVRWRRRRPWLRASAVGIQCKA